MPDAGDFQTGAPNRNENADVPGDWGSAFAALPLHAPDANAWQRVQARLPAATPAPRTRWPLWLATAASLALAVAIPLRLEPGPVEVAGIDGVAPSPASNPPATPAANRDSNVIAVQATTPQTTMPATAPAPATKPQVAARRTTPARQATTAPSQRPIRTLAQPAGDTRVVAADSAADLEPLYAQSAQLEGLLAMARDDRVASGPAAALTEDLDARVASIDAALIQPDLPSQRRSELWGERVDTLRQLVGVEATQRLLASRGQQYDAALVSID